MTIVTVAVGFFIQLPSFGFLGSGEWGSFILWSLPFCVCLALTIKFWVHETPKYMAPNGKLYISPPNSIVPYDSGDWGGDGGDGGGD